MHITNEHTQRIDSNIILTPRWNDPFRVTEFTECVELLDKGDGSLYFEYRILCRGPLQTKLGRDHASRTANTVYVEGESKWSELPFPVKGAAIGKNVLVSALRRAFDAATEE